MIELKPFIQDGKKVPRFLLVYFDGDEQILDTLKTLAYCRIMKDGSRCILSEELGKLAVRLGDLPIWTEDDFLQNTIIQKREEALAYAKLQNERGNHPVEFPGLKKPAYAYQAADINLMLLKARCLNANQVGLGKGVEAVATGTMLHQQRQSERALIICPASIKADFADKIQEFTEEEFIVIGGDKQKREELYSRAKNAYFTIINYDLIRMKNTAKPKEKPVYVPSWDLEQILSIGYDTIFLDEATALKSGTGVLQGRGVQEIMKQAKRVYGFTGTPVMNHIDELYQIIKFIDPNYLPSKKIFDQIYINPFSHKPKKELLPKLHERLQGIMIRRTKEEVLPDLPKLLPPVNRYVELEGRQKEMYEEALMLAQVYLGESLENGLPVNVIIKSLLGQMIRLKQICVHPELLEFSAAPTKSKHPSAKLAEIQWLLRNDLQDEKVIIFTQFEKFTRILERELTPEFGPVLKITGQVNLKDRELAVKTFQNEGEPRILLLTTAGGMGLTLTAAHHIIMNDQVWNPAIHEQVIGRLHRISQKVPVTPIWLWVKDGIEQRVYRTLERKKDLAARIVDGKPIEENKFTIDDMKDWFKIA